MTHVTPASARGTRHRDDVPLRRGRPRPGGPRPWPADGRGRPGGSRVI